MNKTEEAEEKTMEPKGCFFEIRRTGICAVRLTGKEDLYAHALTEMEECGFSLLLSPSALS